MIIIFVYILRIQRKKYQYFFQKHQKIGLEDYKGPKAFIEYSNNIQDLYKNNEELKSDGKHELLMVFNNMIANIIVSKNLINW